MIDFIYKIGLISRPLGRKTNPFATQTGLDTSRLASGLFIIAFNMLKLHRKVKI